MARFSVLIPVYNGADFIDQALQSIAEQTLKDVQVIVSNNASTDGTAEILKDWQDRLNLKVITQPRTLPMQSHFNAVLDAVETEFYMLLCHDDYLSDPNALELAVTALDEYPDAGAVYCDLLYVNANRRTLARRRFNRRQQFSADAAGLETIKFARNLFGIPIGVRTAHLGKLRYDPRFHYTMDVDLSWSISKGQTALHISKPLISNRYTDTNTTWSLLPKALQEFIDLSEKYGVPMGRLSRFRLIWTNFFVNQQKRLFNLYARLLA